MSVSGLSLPRLNGGERPAALTRADRRRDRRWYIAGCVTVVLVALFLRAYDLGSQSFWIDEINVTTFVRSGHLFSDLRDRGGPFEPPLHFLTVLAALELPFGFETAARIPSMLFGTLEVFALILLTREVTNRRDTALVAGLLLAVAPFVVRYSQENRYYVMFSALSLLSWWLLMRALRLRRDPATGSRTASWPLRCSSPIRSRHWCCWSRPGCSCSSRMRARRTGTAKPLWRGYGIAVILGLVLIAPWYVYGASDWISGYANGKRYGFNPDASYAVPFNSELFTRLGEWLLGQRVAPNGPGRACWW